MRLLYAKGSAGSDHSSSARVSRPRSSRYDVGESEASGFPSALAFGFGGRGSSDRRVDHPSEGPGNRSGWRLPVAGRTVVSAHSSMQFPPVHPGDPRISGAFSFPKRANLCISLLFRWLAIPQLLPHHLFLKVRALSVPVRLLAKIPIYCIGDIYT
jgi:hypothetical protein